MKDYSFFQIVMLIFPIPFFSFWGLPLSGVMKFQKVNPLEAQIKQRYVYMNFLTIPLDFQIHWSFGSLAIQRPWAYPIMCSRKTSVDKKVELTPHFSGVDHHLQSAKVRQRWDQSWSWSGSSNNELGVRRGIQYCIWTLSAQMVNWNNTL